MPEKTLEFSREQLQDVLPLLHRALHLESDERAVEMIATGHREWECKFAEAQDIYRRRQCSL